MDSVRILIAMGNEASLYKMKTLLVEAGYSVVELAKDGHDCLRKARSVKPDIALVDYDLPLMNGLEVCRVLLEDNVCAPLVIVHESQRAVTNNMIDDYDIVCMTKPLNRQLLISTIDLMTKNIRKVRRLEKEIEDLKGTLETRKEVERAKGLLMKKLGMTEQEAFKRIQKQSMDKGLPMREIAKAIIIAYEI